jgi:hypothetical protein
MLNPRIKISLHTVGMELNLNALPKNDAIHVWGFSGEDEGIVK